MDVARLNMSHGDARRPRAERGARPRGREGLPAARRADRRPAGPEAPDRRPRRAATARRRRTGRDRRRGRRPRRRPARSARPCSARCSQPGNDVLIDDGHVRLRVEQVERGRVGCAVRRRRRRQLAQGRQPPGRAAADPVAHAQGPRRSRRSRSGSASTTSRSRSCAPPPTSLALRTLIEARGSHAWVIAKIEKAEAVAALDEILAEAARGDGRSRRSRRRDRRRRGAAPAEADHPQRARAREAR